MILERLVIQNFRQFKGKQELLLADLRDRNVTVVHAENGFGKTTILKALLWALYGHEGLKEDFEQPSNIIHEGSAHRCKKPEELAAEVQLFFKHNEGDRYILTRSLTLAQQNVDSTKTTVTLDVMRDGQTFRLERPQNRVQEIIPPGISGFLFFNGERINKLAAERNSEQITDAIQQMLGLKLLATTIKDLQHQSVRGRFRAELQDQTTDEKRSLLSELDGLEALSLRRTEELEQARANLSALDQEVTAVDAKLIANKKAHELQMRRVHLTEERKELCARRDDLTQRLAKVVGEEGYALLLHDRVGTAKEHVARLRNEGLIPARVINSFVQELLDTNTCICNRSLPAGSPERRAVEKQMTLAGDQAFNNAVSDLEHAIGLLTGSATQTREQVFSLSRDRLAVIQEIRGVEDELDHIHDQLGGKDDAVVQQLEDERRTLLLRRDGEVAAIARIEEQRRKVQEDQAEVRDRLNAIEDKEEAAALAQRRIDLLEDCTATLEQILELETQDLRPLLNDEIGKLFRRIMTKDYRAELTTDYKLKIIKPIGGEFGATDGGEKEAGLSTGERTVASLVFIASLVALAKKRAEIPTIVKDLTGSAYPIVIDSPFSSLSIFRDAVARNIPALAPQVLLLVSPETYRGPAEKALHETERVGKRYYLIHHGVRITENIAPSLEIAGNKYEQFIENRADEFTEIREIPA
jgi:DNA sulfur modification protein DndD